MPKNMTLIVLAAGIGKRFWPFSTSKALFPFFGMPLITHITREIPSGVTKMIIVTNPGNNSAIRSLTFPVPTSTVVQKKPNGMGEAVLLCRDVIGHTPLLIMNVDDVVDLGLLSEISKTEAYGAISGWKPQVLGPYGYIAFDGDMVKGIVEKPDAGKEPSPYANIVCHYFSDGSEFISEIGRTKSSSDDVYEKALTALMGRKQFSFLRYDSQIANMKYPWHVLDAMQIFLEDLDGYKGKNVEMKSGVIIEGPVYIEDNVKIFENAKIVGPCYIGKNTVIGNNAIIRSSHIGADCVIGFNCDVTRSYIGDNSWLHANYVGDSVLEGNVSMGSGAALANLRLDDGIISTFVNGKKISTSRNKLGAMVGTGVRIGANASIMPGVKIGKNSFIGSGVVLDRDIPEDSFCVMKPGYIITKNITTAPDSRDAFKKKI